MKKTLIASLAAAAFVSSTAFAADLAVKAPVMKAPPAPVATWTGCYLDAGGGYGMWNQDEFTSAPTGATSTTVTEGGRGGLGRFGGGCDLQLTSMGLSNWVVGVLADYDLMGLNGNNAPVDAVGGGAFAAPGQGNEKESSAWSVGGRLGYLVTPSLLSYVSGGYTETRFDRVDLLPATIGGGAINASLPATTFHGWFIGGGTEYALNLSWLPIQGLFWRNEYRFAQYSAQNVGFFTTSTGVGTGLFENEKKEVQTITSSLVWRFNWGGRY
jgi:outer membrane immunogenic protein